MPTTMPGRNGGTLTRSHKGETMNPNGRPRKWICTLKKGGYRVSEINDTLQVLLSMNLDELKAVYENPKATILEKTVAAALKKGVQYGTLSNIDSIMDRVFGKPKQTTESTVVIETVAKFKLPDGTILEI